MKKILGVEFGSTRIKSILINENGQVLSTGIFEWVNDYIDGHFTYPIEKVIKGLQGSYQDLLSHYGEKIEYIDAIGVSAMMHGYLAFDSNWNLLERFRTWRDTTTQEASKILTEKLQFNMPLRWSTTHYYQAVLNDEKTVSKVSHLQTLAGYVHYLLTGENVIGANDASGMFPITNGDFDSDKALIYNSLLKEKGIDKDIKSLLPKVLLAGANAGRLTEEGAKLIDKTHTLKAGSILCPPEGDMGTGMICTNAIRAGHGNISSGTSANFTIVLEKELSTYYPEIDMIASPSGLPAGLIHTNNCTSNISSWVSLFDEVLKLMGCEVKKADLFDALFKKSLESDDNVGDLLSYNFLSGDGLTKVNVGLPILLRRPDAKFNLANLMEAELYSALASISFGLDILEKENVKIKSVTAHGGYYTTDFIGQNVTSALMKSEVTVMEQASEGGAWGIAILALYSLDNSKPLEDFLDEIFKSFKKKTLKASDEEIAKFNRYMAKFRRFFEVEKFASKVEDV
ncbi:MAG: ATPase [Gammaproteobacteria bacterium]|nr:ATPase [Gammaproteobacteria bacterium]